MQCGLACVLFVTRPSLWMQGMESPQQPPPNFMVVPLPYFVAEKVKAKSAVEAKGLISILSLLPLLQTSLRHYL